MLEILVWLIPCRHQVSLPKDCLRPADVRGYHASSLHWCCESLIIINNHCESDSSEAEKNLALHGVTHLIPSVAQWQHCRSGHRAEFVQVEFQCDDCLCWDVQRHGMAQRFGDGLWQCLCFEYFWIFLNVEQASLLPPFVRITTNLTTCLGA